MKPSNPLLLLASPSLLHSSPTNCPGSLFNTYCCHDGSFSGPIYTSFQASMSSIEAARSSSFANRDSSLQASLASGVMSAFLPIITPRKVLEERKVTVEVVPGLTCVGERAETLTGGLGLGEPTGSAIGSGGASGSGGIVSTASSEVQGAVSSTSTAGAAIMTQAPILVVGAAALVFVAI